LTGYPILCILPWNNGVHYAGKSSAVWALFAFKRAVGPLYITQKGRLFRRKGEKRQKKRFFSGFAGKRTGINA
jgi:hypothetical protein